MEENITPSFSDTALVLGPERESPMHEVTHLQLGTDPGFAASTLTVPGTASFASAVTASSLTASTLTASTLSASSFSVTGLTPSSMSATTMNAATASMTTLTASAASVSGGLLSVLGGASLSSGFQYDFISGLNNAGPAATTSSQSMSVSGSLITMTSGLSIGSPHVIYVSAASTSATCTLTPTSSASTSGVFQNGVEVTIVNIGVSGSRIVIPVSGAGSYNTDTIVISGGHAARFIYSAQLQTWLPVIG